MNCTDNASDDSATAWPSEAQLRRDIRHFERQIARLACPNSTWEQGALKCYRVLVAHRRAMLDEVKAVDASSLAASI